MVIVDVLNYSYLRTSLNVIFFICLNISIATPARVYFRLLKACWWRIIIRWFIWWLFMNSFPLWRTQSLYVKISAANIKILVRIDIEGEGLCLGVGCQLILLIPRQAYSLVVIFCRRRGICTYSRSNTAIWLSSMITPWVNILLLNLLLL